jgi:hypothetical protein
MITELTKKQTRMIGKYRQEWLDRYLNCKNRTDRKKATKYLNWLYEFCGYKKPIIIFLDSPLAMQLGANVLVKILKEVKDLKDFDFDEIHSQIHSQIYSQIYNQIRSQIDSQIHSQIHSQIYSQIHSQIYSQIYSQIRSQIDSQIHSQIDSQIYNQIDSQIHSQIYSQIHSQIGSQIYSQKLEYYYSGYEGTAWYAGWHAYLNFFKESELLPKKIFEKSNNLIALYEANCWDIIYLDGLCVVSDMPTKIKRDEQNRLHSEEGSAIEFADGYKLHMYHGIAVPEKWITNPEKLTKKDWSNESNLEKRRVIQELMGDKFPKKIGSKLISKPSKEFKQKHNLMGLYEVNLPNDPESVKTFFD